MAAWLGLCLLGAASVAAAREAPACRAADAVEAAHVAYVYDGDTVRLDDGRHVRFIGVNAPEIGRHGQASQPGAVAARRALRRLLTGVHEQVGLSYDKQRFDRYHRTLAYVYVGGGRSVETWLLARGLATVDIVPPNVLQAPCYEATERLARARHAGLWHYAAYRTTPVETLDPHASGYRIVRGRVTRIEHARRAVWLHLGKALVLRVAREDLPYLRPVDVDALLGKEVIARGWLDRRRDGPGLFMELRHSSALVPAGAPETPDD